MIAAGLFVSKMKHPEQIRSCLDFVSFDDAAFLDPRHDLGDALLDRAASRGARLRSHLRLAYQVRDRLAHAGAGKSIFDMDWCLGGNCLSLANNKRQTLELERTMLLHFRVWMFCVVAWSRSAPRF